MQWDFLQGGCPSEGKSIESKYERQQMLSPPHHNRFMALFPGPPGWAGARRELLDFMVQRKINRDRHTDHPAGHHSIRTNQCPPPPSPIFLQARCTSCRPTNSVRALKAIIREQKTENRNNITSSWMLKCAKCWLIFIILFPCMLQSSKNMTNQKS